MKKSFVLLLLPLLLASCAPENGTSNTTSNNSQSTTSSTTSSSENSSTTSWPSEVMRDISISGDIIDQSVGFYWEVERTYSIGFNLQKADTATAVISLNDPDAATFEGSNGNYKVTPHKAGDFLLTITDSTGYLYYRTVIKFRNRIPQEDFYDYLVSVDHYQSWSVYGSDLQMVFLPGNQAVVRGTDQGINVGTITFQVEYRESLGAEYIYDIIDWNNTATDLKPKALNISCMGEVIHMMDDYGLLEVFDVVE